jgi:hypothetical protein
MRLGALAIESQVTIQVLLGPLLGIELGGTVRWLRDQDASRQENRAK